MPFYYDPKSTFLPVPEGIHPAVLVQVLELGLQPGYKGGPDQPTLFLSYEMPECLRDDGVPFKIGKQMTISFYEKANLAKHVAALRGAALTLDEQRGFEVQSLLGKTCNLIVTHGTSGKGETVAKIEGAAKYTGKAVSPEIAVTPLAYLDFMEQDPDVLESLPAWLQAIVEQGKPWPMASVKKAPVKAEKAVVTTEPDEFDDDVPF